MRAVNAADQWSHVGRSAGTGNEDEAAGQSLATQDVVAKQVARLRDDGLYGDDGDVQRRQETGHAGALVADIYTHGSSSCYRGEGLRDTDGRVHQLVGSGIGLHARVSREFGEEF